MSVVVWSKDNCPQCDRAIQLLERNDITYEVRKLGDRWTREDLLAVVPAARSVPQIVINDEPIGGYTELVKYLEIC